MSRYIRRASTEDDIDRIVEIYNSNEEFLINHLGTNKIDSAFIRENMDLMSSVGFFTDVIIDTNTGVIVGVADYKPDDTVYLSLFMIDSAYQGKGTGGRIFKAFEKELADQGKTDIRLDVVDNYIGNPVGFWEKQGFKVSKKTVMSWGNKKLDALVMTKSLNE